MKTSFTISATFPVAPSVVYSAWLNGRKHGLMTGEKASCSGRVGGKFSVWDGYIWGKNLELEPDSSIVQSWRSTDFAGKDPDSRLEILFGATKKGCTVTLTHSRLPPKQASSCRQGWKDYYFSPMKEYFAPAKAAKKKA